MSNENNYNWLRIRDKNSLFFRLHLNTDNFENENDKYDRKPQFFTVGYRINIPQKAARDLNKICWMKSSVDGYAGEIY